MRDKNKILNKKYWIFNELLKMLNFSIVCVQKIMTFYPKWETNISHINIFILHTCPQSHADSSKFKLNFFIWCYNFE